MLKFFRTLFSKSKAVDTLSTLPQWLKNGNLEEATQLISKATLPVQQQVPEAAMIRVLKEVPVCPVRPYNKLTTFRAVMIPNPVGRPKI